MKMFTRSCHLIMLFIQFSLSMESNSFVTKHSPTFKLEFIMGKLMQGSAIRKAQLVLQVKLVYIHNEFSAYSMYIKLIKLYYLHNILPSRSFLTAPVYSRTSQVYQSFRLTVFRLRILQKYLHLTLFKSPQMKSRGRQVHTYTKGSFFIFVYKQITFISYYICHRPVLSTR